MKPREWLCLLRFGHKWRKTVVAEVPFLRCARCGKEKDMITRGDMPPPI